jgi:hypothetical protein
MSEESERILLSPRSLNLYGLQPKEATLKKVINLLGLPSLQRSSKQITILQALTKKIKFFIQKVEEIGESMHYESCKSMTYEYFDAGNVMDI